MKRLLFALGLILSLVPVKNTGNGTKSPRTAKRIEIPVIEDTLPDLTIENVRHYIEEIGILFPDIVTAQVLIETGHLRCSGCSLDVNNLFGFNTGGPFMSFDHWTGSVDFYLDWQQRNFKGGSENEYLETLSSRFASDPNYQSKIRSIVKSLKINDSEGITKKD